MQEELLKILRQARKLGARYYEITGKPLGVTGEVAELAAAEKLGLKLAEARTAGYDAWRGRKRVQIKGRAVDPTAKYKGRVPSIRGDNFDSVVLVLLDKSNLKPLEIWEADKIAVLKRLDAPGSKARNERRSMGLSQFRGCDDAKLVWSAS